MTEARETLRPERPARILVAEDDGDMRDLLVGWLSEAGFEVTAISRGVDLLHHLERSVLSAELPEFAFVVSDIQMPLGNALDVLDEFFGCDGVPPMILITAFPDTRARALASRLGAARILEKPFEKACLLSEIQRLRVGCGDLPPPG